MNINWIKKDVNNANNTDTSQKSFTIAALFGEEYQVDSIQFHFPNVLSR